MNPQLNKSKPGKKQKEKIFKNEDRLNDIFNNIKNNIIHIKGIPKKDRVNGAGNLLKKKKVINKIPLTLKGKQTSGSRSREPSKR